MEEEIGSEGTNIPCKQTSRSGAAPHHQLHSVVNVADATREVAFAYAAALQQYHRSSPALCITEKLSSVEGNTNTNNTNCSNYDIDVSVNISDAQYCCYLLEAMPLPGPTWSTTAPCVLAEPPPSASSPQIEGSLGLELLGENQGPSYSWWMGFLDGLDCNMANEEILDQPFVENVVMQNPKGICYYESPFVDAMDLSCCCCPDDWLMVPTTEKSLGDIVMP